MKIVLCTEQFYEGETGLNEELEHRQLVAIENRALERWGRNTHTQVKWYNIIKYYRH